MDSTGQDTDISIIGSLLDSLGVQGIAVLLALAGLWLLRYKAVRKAAAKALAKLARRVVRYVQVTLWAGRMRIGVRLAHRLQHKRWREMCEDRDLAGLKRGKVKRSPQGVDVHVTLNRKLTLETLNTRVTALETGLGTRRGAVRIAESGAANRAIVRISVRDPLPKIIPWEMPREPVSIKTPYRLAPNSFGEWTTINLRQRILLVGASGSGKSSVQRVLAAPVILADDADLEVWDLKQGTESQHYADKAARRITTTEQCVERVTELLGTVLEERAKEMQRLGTSTWPTSPTHPDRVIMVDEGAKPVREMDTADLKNLFTLMEQARAYGIYVWWATQFPKAANLPTELRSQFSAVVALRMRKASESRIVFEDDTKEGWNPHRLPGRGWLLVHDEDHDEPEDYKAPFIHEDEFRGIKACPTRPVDLSVTRPAESPVPLRTIVMDPKERIIRALETAGPDGGKVSDLITVTGLGKSRVYEIVNQLIASGHITRIRQGRVSLVLEGAQS